MRLHYQQYGRGPPVIILHGLFGSSQNWATISRKLSDHFHVLAIDLRNHGHSPHTPEMDYSIMADDIVEFMHQQQFKEATVLGHSMGGKTAMQLALSHPTRVSRLIVADIAPRQYAAGHEVILQALCSLHPAQFTSRKQMEDALAVPDLRTRQFLLKNVARNEQGVFNWTLGLQHIRRNYSQLNQAITANTQFDKPTLFLRGETSDYIADEDLASIRRFFPSAAIETVPKAGHWIHADNPEAFLQIVLGFLQKH